MVTQDEVLAQQWISRINKPGDEVALFRFPEELAESFAEQQYDHIVLSDRYFDLPSFCGYIEECKDRSGQAAWTVMLSDRHDTNVNEQWLKFCAACGIYSIPPHRTRDGIMELLVKRIYGEGGPIPPEGGKIAVFIGTTPNIGTTFVSFGTAVKLAERIHQPVAYLCLNLKSSKLHRYLGIENPEATFDHLRAELRARSLRPERLRQYLAPMKGLANLRVLFGNQLREQAEYVTPEDIEHLLATARQAFPVCIAEVNAYWDNAATVCALLKADSRLLVTTPDLTHFQEDLAKWFGSLSTILGLNASAFDLIVTRIERQAGTAFGIRAKDIVRETGMNLIGKVAHYPNMTEAVNQGKWLELIRGALSIDQELEGAVRMIAALSGISLRTPESGQSASRLKRWLGGTFAARASQAGGAVWRS
jgi:MinD-like ATPase involved in chromosome partitioning or flagellar assembly